MTLSAHEVFGNDSNFHKTTLKHLVSHIVSRLSSRVFPGKDLAHNKRWLEIAVNYTHDSYAAAGELRQYPSFLRPFIHWFLPKCRRLRTEVKDATTLITPEVEKRKERVRQTLAAGRKPPKKSDTIGWMYEVSRGRDVSYVNGQLFLSFAANHTTTETITGCLLDICAYPEVVQPLRKLKPMDSFMKESKRLNYMGLTSMHRYVDHEVQLSDGTILPKGSRVLVTAETVMDPKIFPDPEKFDMYRFYNLRSQSSQKNNWQCVTTSPQYLLCGHGQHAYPGRFFASNEMKIAPPSAQI